MRLAYEIYDIFHASFLNSFSRAAWLWSQRGRLLLALTVRHAVAPNERTATIC